MLKKENRADRKAIEKIFTQSKLFSSENLTFRFILKNDSMEPRISFIAPKSIAKLAVKRNLLRRRGYVALKKYIDQFPLGLVGAFVFKKYQDDTLILENEIKNILNKLN